MKTLEFFGWASLACVFGSAACRLAAWPLGNSHLRWTSDQLFYIGYIGIILIVGGRHLAERYPRFFERLRAYTANEEPRF